MIWIGVVIAALLTGALVTAVASRAGELEPPPSTRRDVLVPAEGALGADDLRAVRFNRSWRGYARDEVDSLLARLESDLTERARAEHEAPTHEAAQRDAAPKDVPASDVPATDVPASDVPAPEAPASDAPGPRAEHPDE